MESTGATSQQVSETREHHLGTLGTNLTYFCLCDAQLVDVSGQCCTTRIGVFNLFIVRK